MDFMNEMGKNVGLSSICSKRFAFVVSCSADEVLTHGFINIFEEVLSFNENLDKFFV